MSRKIEKIIVNKVTASITKDEEQKLVKWLEKKKRNKQIYDDFSILLQMVHHNNNMLRKHQE